MGLCISRKEGESFSLYEEDGGWIADVTFAEQGRGKIRLVIEAEPDVRIYREEADPHREGPINRVAERLPGLELE